MRAREAWREQGALLASACVLMLAVGLAARAATPVAPVAIEWGDVVGEGAYLIPLDDWSTAMLEIGEYGKGKALVFAVPRGFRIQFDGVYGTGSVDCWGGCDPAATAIFSGGANDGGFMLFLDAGTAEEVSRGYPISIVLGEPIDEYGRPLRISDAERAADKAARAAKYGPLLDRVAASARVVTVR